MTDNKNKHDVCIVGGCGHVGLPLAICFAKEDKKTVILDVNEAALKQVARGEVPFKEEGAEELLRQVLASGKLSVTADPESISSSSAVVFIMGTPLDDHLNPSYGAITRAIRRYIPYLRDGQLIILRSTVFPGTSEKINRMLKESGLSVDLAFCPERVLEGKAIQETYELPQMIAAFTDSALSKAKELFSVFGNDLIELDPTEAELAKLYTNVWRYVKFAVANQFHSLANDKGLDYYKIRDALMHDYPRAGDLPKAGFAAGPCLYKDTMMLSVFSNNTFLIGHAAMFVNEGQPAYVMNCLKHRYPLADLTVGILGVAFKANSDDPRQSLAYKLRKTLELECKEVLITDPNVQDERLIPLEELIERSDLLIIGAPHDAYKGLDTKGKPIVDIWNMFGRGGMI